MGAFDGKVLAVSGGTSGINLGVALHYAWEGAKVFTFSRNPEKVEAAVAALRAEGAEAEGRAVDVRDYDAVAGAFAACEAAFEVKVGGDARHIEALILNIDVAIDEKHRDFGVLGFTQHLIPSGDDDRRDNDGVDILGDEGADGAKLFLLFALRIGEFQIDAVLASGVLHVLGEGRTPVSLGADLREADGLRVGERSQRGRAGERSREQFGFHLIILPD